MPKPNVSKSNKKLIASAEACIRHRLPNTEITVTRVSDNTNTLAIFSVIDKNDAENNLKIKLGKTEYGTILIHESQSHQ